MNKKNTPQQLQALWDRALERAAEEHTEESELDTASWNETQGFIVRSSVKAGAQGGMPTYLKSFCTGKCQACG